MWRKEAEDLVFDGVENGIAPSPLKGVANLQNVNIATETGEALASFARFKENQAAITNGTLTASVSDGAILLDAPANLQAGQWITVSASTIPSVTAACDFLVVGGGGGGGGAEASEASGGGGAGGFVEDSFTPSVASYTVTVGAGGEGGATGEVGENGSSSSIESGQASLTYLIVGGGGGGGGVDDHGSNVGAGGGGAGQYRTGTSSFSGGTYTITVGAGGAGGTAGANNGDTGSSSSALGLTSAGGGGGGADGANGLTGASGGGGGGGNAVDRQGGTGTAGNDGGDGANAGGNGYGGGGGGSAAVGGDANGTTSAGTAGTGTSNTISGGAITYAAGGAGGGGGSGAGSNGTANRGNGGDGARTDSGGDRAGGNGGSGVVVIRFATNSIVVVDSTGASSSTSGGDTILTWNTSGRFIFSTIGLAIGGGGGGTSGGGGVAGQNGASGGGGGSGGGTAAGTGLSGQGENGGTGSDTANEAGGGGGGAGAVGQNAADDDAGNGGDGLQSSISGTATYYAGGGGGGGGAAIGTGGQGGGGNGASGGVDGSNGAGGFGGGGGGALGVFAGGNGGSGVVIISYATGSMTATGGAITTSGGNTIHTFYVSGTFTVLSIAAAGTYFVSYKNSSNKIKLSAVFDPYGLYPIAHGTTGTATFSTLAVVNQGISKATEKYNTDDSTEYRYYILDDNGYVWVYDTQVYAYTLANNGVGEAWMLPDPSDYSAEEFNSIAILNGWLIVLNNSEIQGKPTVDLGRAFVILEDDGDDLQLINPFPTHTNFAYVGHQGKLFYCDGNYIGEIFPTTSLATSLTNTQSYSSFTGSGTTGTLTSVISGSSPFVLDGTGAIARLPIVFIPTQTTGIPAGTTVGTVYWAELSATNPRQFSVYLAQSGGSAISIATAGTSYFNTFYPLGNQNNTAGTDVPLFQFTPQRLNLPTFETAQCMVEIGNVVLIGGKTNTVYPWNQVSALPTDLISLPEADVKVMINANNAAFIFAGNKGNVYITNGTAASLVLKVPDYCAGIAGTPLTYIEPRFSWGDAVYLRGRVYFSILDQTSTKSGNCGGVWSFVPSQNFSYGQDTGLQLRLENQNSYGSYNGMATLLIAAENQNAIAPQYWASWQNSYDEPTSTQFGIDQTDDIPVTTYIIESDLMPTGTFLDKKTFQQTEFKFTTPLASGDSIALYWRVNSTSAWTAFDNQENETADLISGVYKQNFQAGQWLQLRAVCTTNATTTSSFNRFKELRVR